MTFASSELLVQVGILYSVFVYFAFGLMCQAMYGNVQIGCNVCECKQFSGIVSGPKLLDYAYHPSLEHKCKKDILIGRIKNSEDKSWKKIRPRPTKTQYVGPYYICKGKCSTQSDVNAYTQSAKHFATVKDRMRFYSHSWEVEKEVHRVAYIFKGYKETHILTVNVINAQDFIRNNFVLHQE